MRAPVAEAWEAGCGEGGESVEAVLVVAASVAAESEVVDMVAAEMEVAALVVAAQGAAVREVVSWEVVY